MESHPVARIFPMMTPEEFEDLKQDIAVNGQRLAIWTYQNQILDGRNRYKACRELDIEPKTQEWDGQGSLVSFVWSLNGPRRNLTPSQRAVIALEILPMLEAEAKEKQRSAGGDHGNQHTGGKVAVTVDLREPAKPAAVQAAQLVGVGESSVQRAKAISKAAPEKLEEIKEGKKTVDAAYRELAQKQPVYHPLPVRDMKKNPYSAARQFATMAIGQLSRIDPDDPERVTALYKVRNYIDSELRKDCHEISD